MNADNFSAIRDGFREPRGPGGPKDRAAGGPPRSAARERPCRPGGSPTPARPGAHEAAAAPEAGRAAAPLPPAPGAPAAAPARPLGPGAPAGGPHSLVFLGTENGGQVLRHFLPAADTAADAADPARRPRETSPGRDDARPAPTAWRRCPIGRGAACAWAGLWRAREAPPPRGPGARATPAGALCRRVPAPRPAPRPRPWGAERADRGREWKAADAGPLHAVASGWVSGARRSARAPPSPHLP